MAETTIDARRATKPSSVPVAEPVFEAPSGIFGSDPEAWKRSQEQFEERKHQAELERERQRDEQKKLEEAERLRRQAEAQSGQKEDAPGMPPAGDAEGEQPQSTEQQEQRADKGRDGSQAPEKKAEANGSPLNKEPVTNPVEEQKRAAETDAKKAEEVKLQRAQDEKEEKERKDADRKARAGVYAKGFFKKEPVEPFKSKPSPEAREQDQRLANFLHFRYHFWGVPHTKLNDGYEEYRARFAETEMGNKHATDGEVFQHIQNTYELQDALMQDGMMSGLRDEAPEQGFETNLPRFLSMNGWDTRKRDQYRGQYEHARQYMAKRMAPYRPAINGSIHDMQVLMGVKEGDTEASWGDITQRMLNIPEKDRELALQAIVELGAPARDDKGMVQKTGENAWRGTEGFVKGLPRSMKRSRLLHVQKRIDDEIGVPANWDEDKVYGLFMMGEDLDVHSRPKSWQGVRRPLSEGEKAKLRAKVGHELESMEMLKRVEDIRENVIDPARSSNVVEQGWYDFVRSAPQMASVINPYTLPFGMTLMMGQFSEDNYYRIRLEQPHLSMELAQQAANAAVPFQMIPAVFADRFLVGKMPTFKQLMSRPVPTLLSHLKSGIPALPKKFAVELGSENFQNVAPYFTQEVIRALNKDMPGAPWDKMMSHLTTEQGPLAMTVIWSTVVSHGYGSVRDVGYLRNQAKNPLLLEAVGYSSAAANAISTEARADRWGTVEKMMQAEREAGRIETNGANLLRQREAAAAMLREEAERRGVSVGALEKIWAMPVMSARADGRTQLSYDDGSKADYATAAEATKAMQSWMEHRGVRMTEEMREVFAKVQGDMEAGREVALQFSPEKMTAQRAVDTGLATKKQMQERGQAGEALLANAVSGGAGTDPVHGKGRGEVASGVGSDADFGATSLDVVSDGVAGEGSSETRVAEDGDYDATLHMAQAMAPEAADAKVVGQILGISRTAFKEGVARTTIRLYEGATPLTLIEEKLEGDASVMMRDPSKRAWLLEALRDVERKTGTTLFRTGDDAQVTDNDIKEAWSHLGQGYFVGRSKKGDDQMLASWKQKGFRQVYADIMQSKAGPAMQAYGTFFRSVWRRGAELNGMRRAGTLDADLEGALRRSLGMGDGVINTTSPTSTSMDGDGGINHDARSLEATEGETSFAELPKQRQDKPESWEEVQRGHPWNSAKKFLPKLKDNRKSFALKRGTWEVLVQRLAKWLGQMQKVSDPWGAKVLLANPQTKGKFADPMENRAAHLIGKDDPARTENRTLHAGKLEWIGSVMQTISDAQVRATNGSETFYFRSYAEGVHMVIVEDGAVKDQYGVVTQYAPELSKTEFEGALVEHVRRDSGLAPQGGPSAVGIPAQPQSQAVQTPQPGARGNTTTDEAGSQSLSLLPESGAARDRFLKSVGTPSEMDTDQERKVFEDFRDRVSNDVPGAVREYIERFGHVVDTDSARELEPAYSASRESRQQYSRATSPVASALAREVYDTLLEEVPSGVVLFNAGGPGSGKSSTLNAEEIGNYAIVYDTVLADGKRAIDQIERALAKGHEVDINYIHQPLEAAVVNTIERSAKPENGRIVEAYSTARTHSAAQKSIFEVAKRFENDPRVTIRVTDNTKFKAVPMTLDELSNKLYTEPLELLEKRAIDTATRYFDGHSQRPEFTQDLKKRVLRAPSRRKAG